MDLNQQPSVSFIYNACLELMLTLVEYHTVIESKSNTHNNATPYPLMKSKMSLATQTPLASTELAR